MVARLVRAANPDWGARAVNAKAAQVQDAISRAKNSMLTWHADTPRVRAGQRCTLQRASQAPRPAHPTNICTAGPGAWSVATCPLCCRLDCLLPAWLPAWLPAGRGGGRSAANHQATA